MKTTLTQAFGLFFAGILALSLSSCKPVEQVDALVTEEGVVAGVVVQYHSSIDKTSVTSDAYQVPGRTIGSFFVSDSNPFKKDEGKISEGGRYVVLLLKAGDNKLDPNEPVRLLTHDQETKIEVRVKQVAPVTTTSGKVIKPWDKAIKPTDCYVVGGGLTK